MIEQKNKSVETSNRVNAFVFLHKNHFEQTKKLKLKTENENLTYIFSFNFPDFSLFGLFSYS